MQLCALCVFKFSFALLVLDIFVLLLPQSHCLETIYGREGENLTLICPIVLPVNATTTWTGPPSYRILSINGEINPNLERRDRLSVIMNAATGIYNLVIMNLNRLEDEGTYSCRILATTTFEQLFVNVAFYDMPSITVSQANQRQEVNESSPFGLTCNVNSSTPTNMSIRNQDTGDVIVAGVFTDILNFTETSAKCYQTAEYICTATNGGGSIESSPVKISVHCGPRPLNEIYFQKLFVTLGSSVDLSVNITGYPLPKSEWTFISTTDKTYLSSFMGTNTSLNITTSLYHLRKTSMKEDEFGLYTLHLTNIIGKFTTYFYVLTEVSKEGILEVPENISVICSSENLAFLSWTTKQLAESTNAPSFVVSYKRLDSQQVLNSTTIIGTNAMLTNLVKNAVYSFTVIAISSKGEKASTSQTCTVPGKPQNKSEASTTVYLLSALVGVFVIVCISQLVYIVIWKVYHSKRKEKSTIDKTGRGGDYVMQDITRIEDHQYQTITSDDKNKQCNLKTLENIKHTKSKTAHEIVLREKEDDQYQNLP